MSLQTNLKGRLRNTFLPKSHGLMPVFEAVVNSIHAIEEKKESDKGQIVLKIERIGQKSLDLESNVLLTPISGFTITDNGCGFNDINFESFETLDSEHKIDKGCRGVGRLIWLKVFQYVEVESYFVDDEGKYKKRSFTFNAKSGVHNNNIIDAPTKITGTTIKLIGFDADYREKVPSQTKIISNYLLEHVLWYFVREGSVPEILVEDGETQFNLDNLFSEHMHKDTLSENISICNNSFELVHIKFRALVNKKHQLAFCAANRLVKEESIQGKIPGLYNKITDQFGEFIYTCYVSSDYLTKHVRSERTSFDITEDVGDLFQDITLKMIRDEVLKRAKEYLKETLSENIIAGRKRVQDFIDKHAPRYRPIVQYISEDSLVIDPDKTDKELELHLHAQWYDVERSIVSEGHDIMQPKNDEHLDEYKERLNNYLEKTANLKKSDLANYVSHRKVIIDLLQKSISKLENGLYAREDLIHELIMPMRKSSDQIFGDSCNLWLINERLAFHNYLASDKTLNSMPITDCNANKEPDLLSLRIFDNPILVNDHKDFPLASISIIEIKRPMRNDIREGEDKDPIDQSLSYLDKIREGKITTSIGRPIPKSDNIPGYCYILCDLTPSMHRRCKRSNLTITYDGMGYFGYNVPSNAYIEVISFDQLVKAAKERNKAFFDKLGLPTN